MSICLHVYAPGKDFGNEVLEMKLQTVFSYHVGVGKQTLGMGF